MWIHDGTNIVYDRQVDKLNLVKFYFSGEVYGFVELRLPIYFECFTFHLVS